MKTFKVTCIILLQLQFYTTALTATIPFLRNNPLLPSLILPQTNVTSLNPSASVPGKTEIDYPPSNPTGKLEVTRMDAVINPQELAALFIEVARIYNRQLRVDPRALMATKTRTYTQGSVKLILHPNGKMSWKMWAGAAEQLGNFLLENPYDVFFGISDNEVGYVGIGDVLKN